MITIVATNQNLNHVNQKSKDMKSTITLKEIYPNTFPLLIIIIINMPLSHPLNTEVSPFQ